MRINEAGYQISLISYHEQDSQQAEYHDQVTSNGRHSSPKSAHEEMSSKARNNLSNSQDGPGQAHEKKRMINSSTHDVDKVEVILKPVVNAQWDGNIWLNLMSDVSGILISICFLGQLNNDSFLVIHTG
jgi:hypothetical protein